MLAILGECSANFASMEADAASHEETDEKAVQDDQTKSVMDKAEQLKTAEMTNDDHDDVIKSKSVNIAVKP